MHHILKIGMIQLLLMVVFSFSTIEGQACKPSGSWCDPKDNKCCGRCLKLTVNSYTCTDIRDEPCKPYGYWCDPKDHKCCGKCLKLGGNSYTCTDGKAESNNLGDLDLSPTELKEMCLSIGPKSIYKEPKDCVYMKWVSCPGASQNPKKPCGWYKQTKCDHTMFRQRRQKRNADALSQGAANDEPILLTFPDDL